MSYSAYASDYLQGLGDHPLFAGLDAADLADLAVVEILETKTSYEVPAERVVLVTRGRVAVHNGERFERLAGPGELIGLLRPGHALRLSALEASALLVLGPIDLASGIADERVRGLMVNVTAMAETELHRLQAERRDLEASLEDFFDPWSGEVAEAPYIVRGAQLILVVARDTELSALPRALPAIPLSDDRFLLVFAQYPHFGPDSTFGAAFEECLVMVPAWDAGGGGPGLYCPEVYPESMMAVILGGELFGFPKRFGRVTVEADHAHVEVAGTQGYLRWAGEKPLAPHDFVAELVGSILGEDDLEGRAAERMTRFFARWLLKPVVKSRTPIPVYVRRRSGRRDFGAVEWEVDELARVPFDLLAHGGLVELESPEFRGWGRLQFAEVDRVFRAEVDLSMDQARPVRDLRPGPGAALRTQWHRFVARKERMWAILRRS